MEKAGKKRTSVPKPGPSKGRKIVERTIKLYTDDIILCLECGLEFASLHNHLAQKHNLKPQEYLEKYGLPDDFPLVAKNIVKRQSTQTNHKRVHFPKPEEITKKREDIRRLKAHARSKGPLDPAVPLDLSASPEGFIILYDGRRVKQLQRYLAKQLGKTVEEYLKEWGLPDCYPRTHSSRFFTNPDAIVELRAAEELRLSAKNAGKSWPASRDSMDEEQEPATARRSSRNRRLVRSERRGRWVNQQKPARPSKRNP